MRGKGHDDEIKERALALLATNPSVKYVACRLGLPESTVRTWKKQEDVGGVDFAELRLKRKEQFVKKSWDMIDKAQFLLKRRLDRAIEKEAELDAILEEIVSDPELTDTDKKAMILRLASLKIDSVKELSSLLGVLYDKQAHASDEHTAKVSGEIGVTSKGFEDL